MLRESSGEGVWRMGSESHELKVTMLENLAPERQSDFEPDSKASKSRFQGGFPYSPILENFGLLTLVAECPLLARSGHSPTQ